MDERNARSTLVRKLAVAFALTGAVGGAAFWVWRRNAPLSRSYRRAKRRRGEGSDDRRPDPESEPGTDPV